MMAWQIADYIFTAIANFMLGGYTGAITITVSIVRNSLIIIQKDSKNMTIFLVLIQIVLGSYFNKLGLIGYLPILSSVSYTIATFMTDKVQWLRWVIIENMLLWLVYDLTIKAYPAVAMDIFISLSTSFAIYKDYKKNSLS
ncbi:hypothetical protein JOC28_000544 [Streptococcus loxodontisalivarius]|uniref:YgjV family protein n=2 Tax=Streptococcus loxodontisalivarius TaxID=1349415 RepID=A0ABS2PRA5_9STRE|nr:hypothetical protein [Streptococcus loxodontisalivarius]